MSASDVGVETVSFFQDDGHRLEGSLYQRAGVTPNLAIVGCPGWGGRRTSGESQHIWRGLAERLASAVLTFDHSGAGKSEGPRDRLDPVRRVRDTRSAITWLAERHTALADRIVLFGSSFGSGIATVAAAEDPRVRALAALATFSSGEAFLRSLRPYWQWVEFKERLAADRRVRVTTGKSEVVDPDEIMLRDPEAAAYIKSLRAREPGAGFRYDLASAEMLIEFDVVGPAARLRGRPSLFLHAERDTLMPQEQSQSVASAAGGRFVLLRGVAHHEVYAGEPLARVLDETCAFFTRALESE
jgi:pimeloyl-ACP methyl ester carboxylesterase